MVRETPSRLRGEKRNEGERVEMNSSEISDTWLVWKFHFSVLTWSHAAPPPSALATVNEITVTSSNTHTYRGTEPQNRASLSRIHKHINPPVSHTTRTCSGWTHGSHNTLSYNVRILKWIRIRIVYIGYICKYETSVFGNKKVKMFWCKLNISQYCEKSEFRDNKM